MIDQDIAICLGHSDHEGEADGAMAPPIVQTSLFSKPSFRELTDALAEERYQAVYSRGHNPTVDVVERKLAALERGESCKCFASGMAAISSVMMGLLQQGDHVVFVNHIYGPTLQLARHLESFGITHEALPTCDLGRVEAALTSRTRMIYCESPGTMLFKTLDIKALTSLAKSRQILTVLDNSWASPLFQKPLTLGVDVVVHSCTKYLGGHSDLVAGAAIGSDELLERIFRLTYMLHGGILAPFDAWLLHRGLRTLPMRMQQHHEAGLEVAKFLAGHPKVLRVFHPLLNDDAELAQRQMTGASGLFSFEIDCHDFSQLVTVIDRLRLFKIGVSWGGVESLVISPARSHASGGDNRLDLERQGIPFGLLRISVGLEGSKALIADLDQALEAA